MPDYSASDWERPVPIRGDVIGRANQRVVITETTVVLAPSTGMAAASIRLVVTTSPSTGWVNR